MSAAVIDQTAIAVDVARTLPAEVIGIHTTGGDATIQVHAERGRETAVQSYLRHMLGQPERRRTERGYMRLTWRHHGVEVLLITKAGDS